MKKLWLSIVALMLFAHAFAQTKNVFVMEIKSEIDTRTTRYVNVALQQAREQKADIVIIEMDTYGGVLTDAKEVVDMIMGFDKPVWVFINSDAASAGALISIACDSIYMTAGATIGAATVVDGSGQKAPDKYQSYMRSIMRSTAESNRRDPRIAEGMVDEDVVIEGIKEKGKIISLSTSEALKYGFCDAKVSSIEEILRINNISDYEIKRFELSPSEKIISLAINPVISGILILIIIAGIYFEMQSPGLGFAGLAALVALIFYLVPYYLNGLAENWEILAFFVGIILIALEVFVIPGFGVTGIAGIIVTLGALVLIMVNNQAFDFEFVTMKQLLIAVTAAMGGLFGGIILLFVLGANLDKMPVYKKMALTTTQQRTEGYVSTQATADLVGLNGIAHTVLRPSGKVEINGRIYDAYTRGDYIDKGQPVEVISDEGSALKVKIRA